MYRFHPGHIKHIYIYKKRKININYKSNFFYYYIEKYLFILYNFRDRALQQREEALVAREEGVRSRESASESALRDVSEERARIAREITKLDMLRVC